MSKGNLNTFKTMNATIVLNERGKIVRCNDKVLVETGEPSSTYVKRILGILFDDSPEEFKKLVSKISSKEYNYMYAKLLLSEYY